MFKNMESEKEEIIETPIIMEETEDKLTEEEKNQIEKEMIEVMQKEHVKQEKVDIEDKFNLKKTKGELIDAFLEMQKTQGHNKFDEQKLKKMTKAAIVKAVGEYTNEILAGPPPPSTQTNTVEQTIPDAQEMITGDSFQMIALAMYNINLALFNTMESSSIALKHRTGDVAVLASLCEKYEKKKEAFLMIFKAIYREHKTELDKYLSPLAQYAILTSQVVAETVFCNIAAKKKVSEQL